MFFIRVGDVGDAVLDRDGRTADQPSHRFAEKEVADQFLRQAVAAENFLPAGGGEVVERVVLADAAGAALDVGDVVDRPDRFVIADLLAARVQVAVDGRDLVPDRSAFAASVDVPRFAVDVLGQAPLTAVAGGWFLEDLAAGVAEPVAVVGGVEPVVQRPDQAAGLVFEVASATAALVEKFFLIGHAVAVGVAVNIKVEGVGLADDQAVVERQQDARKQQFVDEDGGLVDLAVAVGVDVPRDA